eukprot:Filipodium_phascolosomae@DN846_c0_g1_i1.p1
MAKIQLLAAVVVGILCVGLKGQERRSVGIDSRGRPTATRTRSDDSVQGLQGQRRTPPRVDSPHTKPTEKREKPDRVAWPKPNDVPSPRSRPDGAAPPSRSRPDKSARDGAPMTGKGPKEPCSGAMTDKQFEKCILTQIGGFDPSLVASPTQCESGQAAGFSIADAEMGKRNGEAICPEGLGNKSPVRDTSKYYERSNGYLLPSNTNQGSLYCNYDSDCACGDQCEYNNCEGSCDHVRNPDSEDRVDGGCSAASCYSFAGKAYTDFDSDSRPEGGHSNKDDLDTGACQFYNICSATLNRTESPTTGKYNIISFDGAQSEARLNKAGHYKNPSFSLYGECTDRVGDPLPQACYLSGSRNCYADMFRTYYDDTDETVCRGDWTCVRQMGSWFLNADYINGDRKQPSELTSCESSADCCGSWSRSREVFYNSVQRSNVPVVCIPYEEIAPKNKRLYGIVKPKSYHKSSSSGGEEKVCWVYGGPSEEYFVNGFTHAPHGVQLIEKHLASGDFYAIQSYLEEELCGSWGCDDPCQMGGSVSFDESTCHCFEGLEEEMGGNKGGHHGGGGHGGG